MDTYQGRNSDPITLHKYLYANANPVNGIDPSGHFAISTVAVQGAALTMTLSVMVKLQFDHMLDEINVQLGIQQARSCALARSKSSCSNPKIPIIFFGADLLEQTKHIADAQDKGIGLPALSRRWAPHKRGWWNQKRYQGKSSCGPGRTGSGTGKDCDEFPFASTEQGGRSNFDKGRVSLRPINSVVNQDAGRKYLAKFYRKCNVDAKSQTKKWFGVVASPNIPKTYWVGSKCMP